MRRTALAPLVLIAACASGPGTTPVVDSYPVVTSSPVPYNRCVEPLCRVVTASPAPATTHSPRSTPSPKAASRRRSTPVQKPVDLGARTYRVTAYCTGTTTASGKRVREGMVATIPSLGIPFGTKVTIDGFGTYTVEDRIGHGSEIDIYYSSCSAINHFPTGRYRAVFHH